MTLPMPAPVVSSNSRPYSWSLARTTAVAGSYSYLGFGIGRKPTGVACPVAASSRTYVPPSEAA
jgi:hypothetical protein